MARTEQRPKLSSKEAASLKQHAIQALSSDESRKAKAVITESPATKSRSPSVDLDDSIVSPDASAIPLPSLNTSHMTLEERVEQHELFAASLADQLNRANAARAKLRKYCVQQFE